MDVVVIDSSYPVDAKTFSHSTSKPQFDTMKSEKSMRGILSDFSYFKRTMRENQHVQGIIGESSDS